MDKEYINKVVKNILIEGLSKLEIKTGVYNRLDKELKCKDKAHLKILEYEIQQLEEVEMCIVKRMDKHYNDKNLAAYNEKNFGCQSGDSNGKKLNFIWDIQNFKYNYIL